jgi:hypothetical protein
MINERHGRICRRMFAAFAVTPGLGRVMNGTIGFFIAVGIVSAAIFAWTTRSDRMRDRRRAYADATAGDGGTSYGNNSFSLLNWFGGSSSSSSPSSSEDSCTSSSSSSSSFGGGDTSCSSDGGGGGGGGDGGGGGGD